MTDHFDSFVHDLCEANLPGCVANQYSNDNPANSIRRGNLLLYLRQMARIDPGILLVGEAPGYRGCRLTGVPFTSESILLNGVEELGLFGRCRGYSKTNESAKLCKEQTATIVWQTLVVTGTVPLLWNAFPFHPFQAGNERSNRRPLESELRIGARSLAGLIDLFSIETIVAVGNTAEATLHEMGLACIKLRHPANGGKREFGAGIRGLMGLESLHHTAVTCQFI